MVYLRQSTFPELLWMDFSKATYREESIMSTVSVCYSKNKQKYVPIIHLQELIEKSTRTNISIITDEVIVQKYRKYIDFENKLLHLKQKSNIAKISNTLGNLLTQPLMDFQKTGVIWLVNRRRGILADEVGLGKTFQCMAVVSYLFHKQKINDALIICPAHLKLQWRNEFVKFTQLRPVLIDQSAKKVTCQFNNEHVFAKRNKTCKECAEYVNCLNIWEMNYGDRRAHLLLNIQSAVFIVNYEILRIDPDLFYRRNWGIIIVDESTFIKGSNQTTKAFASLKSDYFIAASGTLIENRVEDLYNICNKVQPDLFGTKTNFERAHIVRERVKVKRGNFFKADDYRKGELLRTKLERIMLRRHKADVLQQLPALTYENLVAPMLPKQRKLYDDVYERAKASSSKFGINDMLGAIVYLREICDHAALVNEDINESGKIQLLKTILPSVESQQCVIFTEWKRMGKIITDEIGQNVEFVYGQGMSAKRKQELVDRFTDGKFQYLVTTEALREGVNLQVANILINFELPWNPAKAKQRIGRIDRKGQTKPMLIYNFFTEDTIEDRVHAVLNRKATIARDIVDALSTIPTDMEGLKQFVFNS